MQPTFITAMGLHAESCADKAALDKHFSNGNGCNGIPFVPPPAYVRPEPRLSARAEKSLRREDRPFLTEIAIPVRNAVQELLDSLENSAERVNFQEVPLFYGTESAVQNLAPMTELALSVDSVGAAQERFGELRKLVSPMEALRNLTTNAGYHASKMLSAHGGGYPVRAQSLSGLCALEDAADRFNEAGASSIDHAAVVAAGNMRNIDSVIVFGKLNLLSGGAKTGGVSPSWGAAALLLSREGALTSRPLAEIAGVKSFFVREAFPGAEVWRTMFRRAKEAHGTPDYIVCYANGEPRLDAAEAEALSEEFPGVPQKRYKYIFGYTGKANTLLDLAALLADPSVEPGAMTLINGAGFGYGVGYLAVRKLPQSH